MELEDRIIAVYLRIDTIYKSLTTSRPLRTKGFAPALSDVEVLTIEIIGELQGRNGDRAIWRYIDEHWRHWFPSLSAYKTFAKHCANLTWIKQKILAHLFGHTDDIHIIDGVPMPIAHNARAYRSRMLEQISAWGYCASKDEHFYGLRGHPVMAMNGVITDFIITPANVDERQALHDIKGKIKGLLIGDKGFLSGTWQDDMATHGINLQTPLRDNMIDNRPKPFVKTLKRIRKKIETALSILTDMFAITKIKAHDIWHFQSKLTRKIIAYNFYITMQS